MSGIQAGMQQFDRSASLIASQATQPEGTDLKEMATAAVDMMKAEKQVAASAQVVRASDDILGTLLDVKV